MNNLEWGGENVSLRELSEQFHGAARPADFITIFGDALDAPYTSIAGVLQYLENTGNVLIHFIAVRVPSFGFNVRGAGERGTATPAFFPTVRVEIPRIVEEAKARCAFENPNQMGGNKRGTPMIFDEDFDPERAAFGDEIAVALGDDLEHVIRHLGRAAGIDSHLPGTELRRGVEPSMGALAVIAARLGRGLVDMRTVDGDGSKGETGSSRMRRDSIDERVVNVAKQLVRLPGILASFQNVLPLGWR